MIKVSSSKIRMIAEAVNGNCLDSITFELVGVVKGITASFSHDSADEELAQKVMKKYIKTNFPVLKVYVEIV